MGTEDKAERNFRLIRRNGVLDEKELLERSVLRPANLRRFLLGNLVLCFVFGCYFAAACLTVRFFNYRYWIKAVVNLVAILIYALIGRERLIETLFERDDLLGRFLWKVYLKWSFVGLMVAAIATILLTPANGVSDAAILARIVCISGVAMYLAGLLATVIREGSCRKKVLFWQGRYREQQQPPRSYGEGWELD